MEITRTFDLLDWLLEKYPKDDILNGKRNGEWINFSVNDYYKFSILLSYGFHHLGLRKGDKVATITNNRPEFNIMDMAMAMLGVIHIPIYPTLSVDDYKYIIAHSDAKMLVIGNKSIFSKVEPALPELKNLEYGMYVLDKMEGQTELNEVLRLGIFHRKELAETIEKIKSEVTPDDIATIIYTSGTTGTPKGVMLTHDNLVQNFIAHAHVQPLDHTQREISFLPLCHIYERSLNYHYQYLGVSIYYAENMGTIVNDIADIKAHGFCSVPRVLEMIYDKLYAAGKDLPRISKWIYFAAIRHGQRFDYNKSWWFNMWTRIYDQLVYKKWRKKFGDNEFDIITGGASIQPRIIRLFTAAKMRIYEGYGLTETSPVIAVNNPRKKQICIGSVGPILEGVEVKFSEEGEILTRSRSLMKGYYKDPEYTRQVIDEDGWFHTGDIGEMVDGIYLKITDRKKEIFKLSAGKYIAPQMLENKFKESPFIENIMVIGENEKFASAIISPNFNHLHFWASKHRVHYRDNAELIKNQQIANRFQKEIDRFNKKLAPHEQIKRFRLITDEWTPQTGDLSPTLKLKRVMLMKKYKSIIDEIYNHKQEAHETIGFNIKQIDLSNITIGDVVKRILHKNDDGHQHKEENKDN
jgi:long-chain acyl-CoA synthetase